jgi:hypothetical protein
MKRRSVALGLVVVAAAGLGLLATGTIGPLAAEMCVTSWEDANGAGDSLALCDIPSGIHVPNLGSYTSGLTNGCNRGINQSSSWSDCISSFKVAALPANYKVVYYASINYANQIYCRSTDGTSGVINLTGSDNDVTSSIRVLGGNC